MITPYRNNPTLPDDNEHSLLIKKLRGGIYENITAALEHHEALADGSKKIMAWG